MSDAGGMGRRFSVDTSDATTIYLSKRECRYND